MVSLHLAFETTFCLLSLNFALVDHHITCEPCLHLTVLKMHKICEIDFLVNKLLFDSTWLPVQIAWKVTFPKNPRSRCSSTEDKSNDGADTVVTIADIKVKKSNTRQKTIPNS